jgi:hypothetical protein
MKIIHYLQMFVMISCFQILNPVERVRTKGMQSSQHPESESHRFQMQQHTCVEIKASQLIITAVSFQ